MRTAVRTSLALAVLAVVGTGCSQSLDRRQNNVRPGCVEEKMAEDGYTREFALSVCEGQAYMYGTDEKPRYETELEQLQDDLNESITELESYTTCMERWDYNPPSYVDC